MAGNPKYVIVSGKIGDRSQVLAIFFFTFVCVWILDMKHHCKLECLSEQGFQRLAS